MKFYTREWYELMQGMDYCICTKPVDDKEYTDAEIEKLYNAKLKKELASEKRDYNTPPEFIDPDVDSEDFDLDDYVSWNPETGEMRKFESVKEMLENHEQEKKRALAEFESRPPFDEAEAKREFEEVYALCLENALLRFPEYIRDRIDPRLAALDLLPKSVYDELKELSKANKKKFDEINKAARKILSKQDIPEEIRQNFGYHDGDVLSVIRRDDGLIMTIRKDCGGFFEDETPYTRLTFINAKIIERDIEIPYEEHGDDYLTWLYDELYRRDDGRIEAHMLLDDKYLTVECDDIKFENNIEI